MGRILGGTEHAADRGYHPRSASCPALHSRRPGPGPRPSCLASLLGRSSQAPASSGSDYAQALPRTTVKERRSCGGSDDESTVLLKHRAVDRDASALAQVAHKVVVDGALVATAALRVAGADRE